jgi:hypothetical protein
MFGIIVGWDRGTDTGLIRAEDGVELAFSVSDVISGSPSVGASVEFAVASPRRAGRIFVITQRGVVVTDIRIPFSSVFRLVFQLMIALGASWVVIRSLQIFLPFIS